MTTVSRSGSVARESWVEKLRYNSQKWELCIQLSNGDGPKWTHRGIYATCTQTRVAPSYPIWATRNHRRSVVWTPLTLSQRALLPICPLAMPPTLCRIFPPPLFPHYSPPGPLKRQIYLPTSLRPPPAYTRRSTPFRGATTHPPDQWLLLTLI